MRITIRAGGIIRNSPEREMIDDYVKRSNGLARGVGITKVEEIQIDLRSEKTRLSETQTLLKDPEPGKILIVLDERGKQMTSRQISSSIAEWRDSGEKDVEIVIGGADGFEPSAIPKTAKKWAFGPQTWPHKIVRIMVAEQIYRSLSILAGTPYHRD